VRTPQGFEIGQEGPGTPERLRGQEVLLPVARERGREPAQLLDRGGTGGHVVGCTGTVRLDRIKKAPVYASFGIPHLWLVDPLARSLEVLKLTGSHWALLAAHSEDERVRCEPFQEIEIDLALLWA